MRFPPINYIFVLCGFLVCLGALPPRMPRRQRLLSRSPSPTPRSRPSRTPSEAPPRRAAQRGEAEQSRSRWAADRRHAESRSSRSSTTLRSEDSSSSSVRVRDSSARRADRSPLFPSRSTRGPSTSRSSRAITTSTSVSTRSPSTPCIRRFQSPSRRRRGSHSRSSASSYADIRREMSSSMAGHSPSPSRPRCGSPSRPNTRSRRTLRGQRSRSSPRQVPVRVIFDCDVSFIGDLPHSRTSQVARPTVTPPRVEVVTPGSPPVRSMNGSTPYTIRLASQSSRSPSKSPSYIPIGQSTPRLSSHSQVPLPSEDSPEIVDLASSPPSSSPTRPSRRSGSVPSGSSSRMNRSHSLQEVKSRRHSTMDPQVRDASMWELQGRPARKCHRLRLGNLSIMFTDMMQDVPWSIFLSW